MKRRAIVLGACLTLAGCGGGGGDVEDVDGPDGAPDSTVDAHVRLGVPTGMACPPNSTLTYANFGRPFMESYCLRCHSVALGGNARRGAPLNHDFDTQLDCQGLASHIDWAAASGPNAINLAMPPGPPTPTLEERRMLGEWLACGSR